MTNDTDLFYIRNKHAGYLGNAPTWYGKDGNGYTAYILGAHRFTEIEALRMVKGDPTKWEMFKCQDVDKRLHLVFDIQDAKRLGTNEPCGWPSGYAQNPFNTLQDQDLENET